MKALFAVVCLALLAWWVAPPPSTPVILSSDAPTVATVVTVFDGDTLLVDIDGKREKIRLLGVDTPEVDGPHTTVERCGPEASRRTKSLAPKGATVRLTFDGKTKRDHYRRLLAHVDLADGRGLNELLLREGLAERYRKFGYRKDQYALLEAEAKRKKVGLWASGKACGPTSGK